MSERAIYRSLVNRLAIEVPLFAKALVDDALQRHKLDSASVTPFELKKVIDEDITPRLAKILETSRSPHVSTLGGGLIQIGRDHTIVQLNPGARRLLRLPNGLDPEALYRHLERYDVVRSPEALERSGRRLESWGVDVDGSRLQCSAAAMICHPGPEERIDAVMVTIWDVTLERGLESAMAEVHEELQRTSVARREMADKAQAANEAKSRFLATMSHEIRTPLTAVIGMTSLLLGTELRDDQREMADTAKQSAKVLLTLINAVLDLSKLEAGRLELERIPFDLRVVVGEAASVVAARAREKALVVRSDVATDVPALLLGDPVRLRQVLLNLMDNAVKFTAQGGVELRVILAEASPDRSTLRFEVADTGIGIRPDRLDLLFEPFTQADASTTREYGGSGLGLAICRRIVERLGGELGAQSTEGEGSTFAFTLGFDHAKAVDHAAAPKERSRQPRPTAARHGRVLLADDNAVNQLVITRMLETIGLDIDVVSNGAEAVIALAQPYDLVLMDCQMPVMDGLDATRRIRSGEQIHDPGIPIIALTASAIDDRERCLAAGMDDFVLKPVEPDELAQILDHWLPKPEPTTSSE